jgi:hypothetical protein
MTAANVATIKTEAVGRLGRSMHATRAFLGRQLWVWPVLAAIVLAAAGWWVRQSVDSAMRQQLAGHLTTILNADVEALRAWMKEQQFNAQILAHDDAVVRAVRKLVDLAGHKTLDKDQEHSKATALNDLRKHLGPRLKIFGYTGFFIISPSSRVVAADCEEPIGKDLEGYRKDFFGKVQRGESSVSRPFRSPLRLPDAKGNVQVNLPTMFTAAPVRDGSKTVVGVLGLRIRPEAQFTEILQVARFGKSGETYAFDKDGLLLSSSRFDDELKKWRLIPDREDVGSVLTLKLYDPQVNMTEGVQPPLRQSKQALTRMAADAVAGHSGTDVEGYRDYRGVPTIGAWTWLPEYGFGVATEVDLAEAFAPLGSLRLAFWSLMGLLGLCAAGMFVFTLIVRRHQRAMQQAVLAARQLGQYTLEEKIGVGAMGSVYRARHAMLRRPTAVKLLEPEKMSAVAVARFEREVQLTSQLNHPNTVAIYDYGRTPEGVFYYAMEYLDGINLEDLVGRHGPQPEGRVIAILRQVCGSLAEAHGLGMIHRDIKPANIILGCRGGVFDFAKVLDFGLVKDVGSTQDLKLTAANSVTGTPLYLSPEGIERPDAVDARSDLYAVGAVGYFLLTGTPVFQGGNIVEVCRQHATVAPEPPSQRLGRAINPCLEALLLRCLAKSPSERPASAQAVIDELDRCEPAPAWTCADAETWWVRVRATKPAAPKEKKDPYGTLDARRGWSTAGASTADPYATIDAKRSKGGGTH